MQKVSSYGKTKRMAFRPERRLVRGIRTNTCEYCGEAALTKIDRAGFHYCEDCAQKSQ